MIDEYLKKYSNDLHKALKTVDLVWLTSLHGILLNCIDRGTPIVVFGNGGSCAVAEHLTCDFTKGVAHVNPTRFPKVESLVSNQSLITAIANDYGYEQIFSKQIEYLRYDRCLALAISSSGNSENIIRGLKAARDRRYLCAAFVGFDGGRVVSDQLALGLTLHVKSNNYGIVEDAHQIIMHIIAQHLQLELSSGTQ